MARQANTRRHTRFDVEGIEGSFLFNLEVDVQNLSVAGMAVQTGQSLGVGRRYIFTIRKGDETFRVSGRVVWCVLGGTRKGDDGESRPVFNAGVQFDDVLSENGNGILRFIEDNAVLKLDKRVFGRFRLGEHAHVEVDAALEFEVRRISMSGLLAEVEGEVGKVAQVDEVFPIEIALPQGRFLSQGRVAYVHRAPGKAGRDGTVQLGIEFHGVQEPARELLERFIASVVEADSGDS